MTTPKKNSILVRDISPDEMEALETLKKLYGEKTGAKVLKRLILTHLKQKELVDNQVQTIKNLERDIDTFKLYISGFKEAVDFFNEQC